MSQKRCSICRQTGHNKTTCPDREKKTSSPTLINRSEFTLETPENWNSVDSVVELEPSSLEFKEQKINFLKSFKHKVKIYSIKRLQNPVKKIQYELQKKGMAIRDNCSIDSVQEKILFHGTSLKSVKSININGFNRSFGVVQAFGNGVYFARDSILSADPKFSKPEENDHQFVYVAKVLTGHYTLGKQGMKFPPVRESDILYDSLVNDIQNPTIYVSGHNDNQIYPEYLIEFKQSTPLPTPPLGYINIRNLIPSPISVWWLPQGNNQPKLIQQIQGNSQGVGINVRGNYGQIFEITKGCSYVYGIDSLISPFGFNKGKILNIAVTEDELIEF